MKTANETSSDPSVHSRNLQAELVELIEHARQDVERVSEPRFQALLGGADPRVDRPFLFSRL